MKRLMYYDIRENKLLTLLFLCSTVLVTLLSRYVMSGDPSKEALTLLLLDILWISITVLFFYRIFHTRFEQDDIVVLSASNRNEIASEPIIGILCFSVYASIMMYIAIGSSNDIWKHVMITFTSIHTLASVEILRWNIMREQGSTKNVVSFLSEIFLILYIMIMIQTSTLNWNLMSIIVISDVVLVICCMLYYMGYKKFIKRNS